MKADRECFECCRNKVESLLEQYGAADEVREVVKAEVESILEQEGEDLSAPVMMTNVIAVVEKKMNIDDAYAEPKEKYNKLLLGREQAIQEEIAKEEDMFMAGIQYAITGNYIDFGAMSDVNEEKLNELLEQRASLTLDEKELKHLKEDLGNARKMVYITDNAGEVVLDKAFIKVLKELYPQLEITVMVRGLPVLNDATCVDAEMIGLDQIVSVVSNGTRIPGTSIEEISEEALSCLDEADLCIAKGQGNFETLRGSNRNIYYLFLCKCELFVKKFGVERFTPVLSNEKRIVQYA